MKYLFFCGLNGNLNAVFFFFEPKALTCLLKLHNKVLHKYKHRDITNILYFLSS